MEFNATDRRLEGSTPLRQAQLAELYILDVFDAICAKHNLTYFLAGGALLGAMRHGGFIPWDDDIDVAMPMADYRKFLKIAEKELPSNLLVTPGSEYSGRHPMGKIYDRTSFFCEGDTDVRYPCGIYLDIFPQSKQPKLPRRLGEAVMRGAGLAWISLREHLSLRHHSVWGIFSSGVKAFVWWSVFVAINCFSGLMGLVLPTRWHDPLGFLTRYYHDGFTDEDLFPVSKVTFEGKSYCAPRDVEKYLVSLYGNWRELPPPEKREYHASIICPTQAPDAPWARPYGA